MTQENKIHFTKMHGAGNDYIYVDTTLYDICDPAAAAVAWSDRHKGIGSDGLVLIGAADGTKKFCADNQGAEPADFTMRIFNADGSEARMCGNASRCIGKYVYEKGLTTKTEIRLRTLSGVKVLKLNIAQSAFGAEDGKGKVESVTVDMGKPVFDNEAQFVPSKNPLQSGVFVSMGNPHYVVFTDEVDRVEEVGSKMERHEAFPERCNIELAVPIPATEEGEDTAFRVRVWERGSGVTMACGTGACATAVAACLTGRAGRRSRIVMDGGELEIEWRKEDGHVYMTGPAEFVFEGEAREPVAQ